MIGNARQHVSEPGAWIDIVQFGGDDQRIYGRGPFATTVRTREQPCFSAQGYASQRPLGRIVRETNSSIVEEPAEGCRSRLHVVDCLRLLDVARILATYIAHPVCQTGDEWSDLILAHCVSLFMRQTVDRALEIKDRIDPSHRFNSERRFREMSQLEEVASAVRPAQSLGQRDRLPRFAI